MWTYTFGRIQHLQQNGWTFFVVTEPKFELRASTALLIMPLRSQPVEVDAPMMPPGPLERHASAPQWHGKVEYVQHILVLPVYITAPGPFEWLPPPAYQHWLDARVAISLPCPADAYSVHLHPAWRRFVPTKLWRPPFVPHKLWHPPSQPLKVSKARGTPACTHCEKAMYHRYGADLPSSRRGCHRSSRGACSG